MMQKERILHISGELQVSMDQWPHYSTSQLYGGQHLAPEQLCSHGRHSLQCHVRRLRIFVRCLQTATRLSSETTNAQDQRPAWAHVVTFDLDFKASCC